MIDKETWLSAAASLGVALEKAEADYEEYLALRALVEAQRAKLGSMDLRDLIADSVLRGLWLGQGGDPYRGSAHKAPSLAVVEGGKP